MMNPAAFFGDDEQTAAEGPYVRLVKLRKWVYFAALLASMNAAGHINIMAASKLLGGLAAPDRLLFTAAVVGGLLLLTLQYGLLLLQARTVYDLTLRERTANKRQTQLDGASADVASAETEFQTVAISAEEADRAHDRAATNYQTVMAQLVTTPQMTATSALLGEKAPLPPSKVEEAARRTRDDALSRARTAMLELKAAEQKLEERRKVLEAILNDDPARRPNFLRLERWLDILRLAPPMGAALIAWGHIVLAVWNGLPAK